MLLYCNTVKARSTTKYYTDLSVTKVQVEPGLDRIQTKTRNGFQELSGTHQENWELCFSRIWEWPGMF